VHGFSSERPRAGKPYSYTPDKRVSKTFSSAPQRVTCRHRFLAHHILANGVSFFEEICARDLEGIVAKRKRGVYRDDGKDWLKIKNPNYSRAEGRLDVLMHKRK
jgi:ATP-dependent DNA ligase